MNHALGSAESLQRDSYLHDINNYKNELEQTHRLTPAVEEALKKAAVIRHKYTIVFYLAGGLTGVSEEVKSRYGKLSKLVGEHEGMFGYAPHLHGTDPVQHPHVSPEEVRDIDYLFSVIIPDLHINCWHPIAHGNAVEAGWAEVKGIPAVYMVPKEVILSRLVRGMRNIATTITYSDFEKDGLHQLKEWLRAYY